MNDMNDANDATIAAGEPTGQTVQPTEAAGPLEAVAPAGPTEIQPAGGYPAVEAIATNPDDEAEMQLALQNLEERRKRRRRNRIIKIVVACGVIAGLIAFWLISNALNAQRQQEEEAALLAASAMSAAEPTPQGIQATGTLKPGSSALVTPEVSGIVQEVRVTEGQHVETGDVLFTMKSDEAEKELSDAQTALDRAQRGISKAQSGVSQAQQDYDSAVGAYNRAVDAYNASLDAAADAGQAAFDSTYQKAVAAIPSTATEAERNALIAQAEEDAQLAYDEAYAKTVAADPGSFDGSGYAAGVDSANDAVTTAQEAYEDALKAYNRAQELMDKCQVKAPRSGTVLSLNAVVGASVGGTSGGGSSEGASALIGDLSTLEVDIEVNEIDVSGVEVGQVADVTFPAFPDIQEKAEVVSVAATATNSAGDSGGMGAGAGSGAGIVTFTVKLVIKHPDERLKAGMSASVSMAAPEADAMALAPDGAAESELPRDLAGKIASEASAAAAESGSES